MFSHAFFAENPCGVDLVAVDAFKSKVAAIMVVEQSSGIRPSMTEVFRELGFTSICSVDSLDEAVKMLEVQPIDWLVTSLFPESKTNALQILKIARAHAVLKDMKISLFVNDAERSFLPFAFELGLFTDHEKPFNKDSFKIQIQNVLKTLETNNWSETSTSATYLRTVLKRESRYASLLNFEKKLQETFPSNSAQLIELAEAHFLKGEVPKARSILWQAEQRESSLAPAVKAMSERYLANDTGLVGGGWKDLSLGTCVIVDPDTLIQASLKDLLSVCGAKDIIVFDNGEACWQWMKSNEEPALLVVEWRIPGVPSPILLQRCRSHGYHGMAIIVHSSLVQKQDQPLLREMGVNEIAMKPFRKDDFLNCVAATIGADQKPGELRSLEQKVLSLIAMKKIGEAEGYMDLYLKKVGSAPNPGKIHLEAEFAFASGDFPKSRELAAKSISLGNKSVSLLNLLGKALMQLRDFTSALKVFQVANTLAPNSVSRLCSIAETQQELGDSQAAIATLNSARDLDSESQDVINSSVRIGLMSGEAELVQSNFENFKGGESVLAYINNKAIALARTGDYIGGIALYQKALATIPADKARLRAIISYNMGLAHARKGDAAAVAASLEIVENANDPNLAKKIASLLARARKAMADQVPIHISVETAPTTEPVAPAVQNASEIVKNLAEKSRVDSKPEVSCCFGIYKDEIEASDLIAALLSESINFRPRIVG